jgi:hypothetical protein
MRPLVQVRPGPLHWVELQKRSSVLLSIVAGCASPSAQRDRTEEILRDLHGIEAALAPGNGKDRAG